jgi:hypothetical protein
MVCAGSRDPPSPASPRRSPLLDEENPMTDIDAALNAAANIRGAFAVALVDYDSGMTLGARGGSAEFDLDVAAPGNSEVVRTKLDVMDKLGLSENIEDILITLDTQYHLIRPIWTRTDDKLFFYLALNRAQANLAMARRDLRIITQRFSMDGPATGPDHAFFPSNGRR